MLKTTELERWVADHSRSGTLWLLQRLTGTDTLAAGARISGILVPRELLERLAPSSAAEKRVPPIPFIAVLGLDGTPHAVQLQTIRALYFQKVRYESRLAGWGGARLSPLVRPDSTGALVAFAFSMSPDSARRIAVWLARDAAEEQHLEMKFGPVEPGIPRLLSEEERTAPATLPGPESTARMVLRAAARSVSLEARLLERHRAANAQVSGAIVRGDARAWSDAVLAHLVADVMNEDGMAAAADTTTGARVLLKGGESLTVASVTRFRDLRGNVMTMQRGADESSLMEALTQGARIIVPRELFPFYPARVRSGLTPLDLIVSP